MTRTIPAAALALLLATASALAFDAKQLDQLYDTGACPGCDLSGADLTGTDLGDTNMSDADLSGANFTNAQLVGADLRGANLQGANLDGTMMDGVTLFSANLLGATNWNPAGHGGYPTTVFCNTTMPDGQIDNSGC
jgi:hypothetical protein